MKMRIVALSLIGLCLGANGYRADDATPTEKTPQKAMTTWAFPLSGAPYLAAYRWGAANKNGGAPANIAFAKWIGKPAVWAEDFTPNERWEALEGGDWQLGEWSNWKKEGARRRLILSVCLLPGGWDRSGPQDGAGAKQAVSLEAGARGDYNKHFKTLAQNLVRYGLADSVLRLGWEFNGGWYTWRASDNPQAFAGYWQQIVKTMRAVEGTEHLQFCWNPARGWLQFPAEQAWPGDDFVDIVGLDVYDDSWLPDTYPFPKDATPAQIEERRRATWDKAVWNGDHGLKFWRDFAIEHKKPFALPEWGVRKTGGDEEHGGLDNPYFIEKMHEFISDPANKVYFHCYFDVQGRDEGHQISPGKDGTETTIFPLSSAKYKTLFGD